MTEQVTDNNQIPSTVSESNTSTTVLPDSVDNTQSSPPGRTYTDAEVNDIVGRKKREFVERYERSPSQPAPDRIKQIVSDALKEQQEEYNAQQVKQMANQIAGEFNNRLVTGKTEYEDFDKVMADFNAAAFPEMVQLSLGVDNTAAVMYNLANNPEKAVSLTMLAKIDPKAAAKRLKDLSDSIKQNKAGKNIKMPSEPLSQLRASTTGSESGSDGSVVSYRNKYQGKC